ncbi:hypothetical protein P3342_011794 [Pyrenophora teres f. teres]|uniref:Uncharacterized protein n=1 Tax=Pyrenophora teres f. teres TaxID=97479 RepID=A0A6S6WC33_9PLEO|nr:hypothetical protein HRS9139_10448 [Pyrenophora teres f. teres]KAE8822477.1 hypothetical protein PTNB85_10363 [Pyrenophora teres f. teres]KAE8858696.1 hypothetical protein PTNB29_07911 [Pyrenophora teres f. teres]KAE8861461.1 hypothetical protein PTNB73_07015 [Pyrenophora teres f. teres]KAK1911192.1 hypothetical protein P3342_011794 [Pyrenophora teres f. teres]
MTEPTPATASSAPRRPLYHRRADGTRGPRIYYPPPPRPTKKPISDTHLDEVCAFWDFAKFDDQPADKYDRAEHLLYDMSTGPWFSEKSRKWNLHCAVLSAIERLVQKAGFTGMGSAAKTSFVYRALYDVDEETSQLPEWMYRIVKVEPHLLRKYGYRPDFPPNPL